MLSNTIFILASFSAPEEIGVNAKSMLWMVPLAAAIACVYKAIKLQKITIASFVKEAAILFVSIVVFIITAAVVLTVITFLATE